MGYDMWVGLNGMWHVWVGFIGMWHSITDVIFYITDKNCEEKKYILQINQANGEFISFQNCLIRRQSETLPFFWPFCIKTSVLPPNTQIKLSSHVTVIREVMWSGQETAGLSEHERGLKSQRFTYISNEWSSPLTQIIVKVIKMIKT